VHRPHFAFSALCLSQCKLLTVPTLPVLVSGNVYADLWRQDDHRPPCLLVLATGHRSSPCGLWNFRRRTRRTFIIRGFVTIASAHVLGTTRRRPQKCTVVAITPFVLHYRRNLQTLPMDHSAERLKRQKSRSSVVSHLIPDRTPSGNSTVYCVPT